MRTVPLLRRRISLQLSGPWARSLHDGGKGSKDRAAGRQNSQRVKGNGNGNGGAKRIDWEEKSDNIDGTAKTTGPSLFEQLFPDQEAENRRQEERELPRIPLQPREPPAKRIFRPGSDETQTEVEAGDRWSKAKALRRQMERHEAWGGQQPSVLVLRNASKNLVEDDFRRLIPQGQHMEGWKLEQGNFLQIIPGRDWQTLEQQNYYYLLFSSALSAFTYQGHAIRVHRLVARHTPSSQLSPILPPPGYMVEGMDAHEAIESFSLVPPNQSLDLRQLKDPLTPMMQSIVRNRGYANLLNRKDRMPYEVRLTLEGPQLHQTRIRHILLLSGRDRRLSWSGGEEVTPQISEWNPSVQFQAPSAISRSRDAAKWALNPDRMVEGKRPEDAQPDSDGHAQQKEVKQRTPGKVFIVGFHTETAMQSFARFWHRRPMEWKGTERMRPDRAQEDDLAPITRVEILW